MNAKKLLSLFLILLLTLPLFVACDRAGTGGETTEKPTETPAPEATESTSESTTLPEESETDPPTVLTLAENGTSQYRIIINDKQSEALIGTAYEMINAIESRTGAQLSAATDFVHELIPESAVTDYEILLGTVRNGTYFDITLPELSYLDFYITVVGTRVIIYGGSTTATVRGANYFLENYLPAESIDLWTIPIATEELKISDSSGKLTIMSQNLLNNNTEHAGKVILGTDIPVDQANKNSIKSRQPRIRDHFLSYMPDAIGLQECGNWHSFLETDSALRDAGYRLLTCSKNNKISIYYNKNTLTPLESGSIYLTEDPENLACSKEWNSNGNPRLAHFVRFEINATGETFVMVNTHIGFDNQILQYNQTRVVAEYCAQLKARFGGEAVVCVGDFNSKLGSAHIDDFLSTFADGFMADTRSLAVESATGTGSFHALGSRALDANAIDQVMVSENDWTVYTYLVDNTVFGEKKDQFYSDHFGVVATMILNPKDE